MFDSITGPTQRTKLDLMGIRFVEGEGGNAPAPEPAAPTPAAPAPAGEPAAPAAWDGKVESLDPRVQKMITDLRTENANTRVAKNAETERVAAILKAAGIETGEADPVEAAKKAAAERDAATATAAQAARELSIFKAAATAGADPTKLLDSNSFMTSVKDLDPTDGTAVAAAIEAAVKANPTFKAARAAGASGTELGGTGEQGQINEEQLARMTPEQISDAYDKGLLKNLL